MMNNGFVKAREGRPECMEARARLPRCETRSLNGDQESVKEVRT